MTVPLEDPESLTTDILQVVTASLRIPVPAESVEGTGFLLAGGVFVTCWHCVAAALPTERFYAGVRDRVRGKNAANPLGGIERVGQADLAVCRIAFEPELGFRIADQPPPMGAAVWTFGYPLTEVRRRQDGSKVFLAHPRLLRGHITRRFVYEHPSLGPVPSWELSFAAPEGLSGAPLMLEGTLDVIGVIYGNNDAAAIEQFASIDPVTGKREPEIQRIVSFGLAHYLTSLDPIKDRIREATVKSAAP
jgi:hypothetical protein